jgi:hypothetical protein
MGGGIRDRNCGGTGHRKEQIMISLVGFPQSFLGDVDAQNTGVGLPLQKIGIVAFAAADVDEIVLGMKIAPGSVHHQLAEWFIVSFVQKGAAGQHHGAVISVVFLAGAVVHGEVHIVISGDIKGVVVPALKRNAIGVKSVMADWTL